jgi:hypothetical protein
LSADPPDCDSKPFLRKLGLQGNDPSKVEWTPDLVGRGLDVFAAFTGDSLKRFRDGVGVEIDENVEELTRKVQRLE